MQYQLKLLNRIGKLNIEGQDSQARNTKIHYDYFLDNVYGKDCNEAQRLNSLEDDPINIPTQNDSENAHTDSFGDFSVRDWYGNPILTPKKKETCPKNEGNPHDDMEYQGFHTLPETICRHCGRSKKV